MLIFQMARLLMLWKRYQDNWGENIRKFLIEIQILLATGKELSNDIGNYDVRNYQRYFRNYKDIAAAVKMLNMK